ncbi:hypothetical protein [Arthrobacter sp. BE255]|nr:hypothetical protein [Arthrobacter sp. BE255]MDR7158260.1 hypothetical protein [Arthrobacter sp. BE255]
MPSILPDVGRAPETAASSYDATAVAAPAVPVLQRPCLRFPQGA